MQYKKSKLDYLRKLFEVFVTLVAILNLLERQYKPIATNKILWIIFILILLIYCISLFTKKFWLKVISLVFFLLSFSTVSLLANFDDNLMSIVMVFLNIIVLLSTTIIGDDELFHFFILTNKKKYCYTFSMVAVIVLPVTFYLLPYIEEYNKNKPNQVSTMLSVNALLPLGILIMTYFLIQTISFFRNCVTKSN